MLGGAQAAAAVCAETRDETDKANKEFDRWSDDDTPQVKATKEREFDAWSEDSVELVEEEQKEDQEFFFDAAPDQSLGVSSKHSAPHPSAPKHAEVEARLSPRPPKAPPPAHLLQQAERQAVEWLRKKAEVPVQPPPPAPPAMAMPAGRGRPVPPPRLMRPQSAHPVVQPVPHAVPHAVPRMAGQVGQVGQVPQTMPQMPVRQVAVAPVVLVPVSPCATWTCFISLQHGLERMKLLATLLLGDAAAAQALVQDASSNLKLSHRTSFEDVKKAALKAVLQLVPMTDAKDQQARDSLEKYLLSKDRAGVVRVGMRDLYLIPPSKAEDCGLKVVPQANLKCIVAAVAEKSRSKKSKSTAEVKKKAAEVVVADDTEDSEEPKNNEKKVDNSRDKEDDQKDQKDENKDGEAAAAEEKSEETKKEDTNEDLKAAASDEKKEDKEAKPEAKKDKDSQASKVPHSPFESLKAQAKPQAKPRFSRLDVENAAFEIARSRDDRQVRPEPSTSSTNLGVPRGPLGPPHPGHPGHAPGHSPWPAFPEPWWNPYVSPHTDHGAQPERRRKRHRSSKTERRRTRRRSKSSKTKAKADSQDSDTSAQSKSRPSEPAKASFRNPYIDPVPTEQPTETEENNSEPVDEKWKGLLARVEALAEFCRADSVEDG